MDCSREWLDRSENKNGLNFATAPRDESMTDSVHRLLQGNSRSPEDAKALQLRFLVRAHWGEAGHCGREETMGRFRPA